MIFNFESIFLESQKSFYALRIFEEDKKFLNFTYGPIYLIYLKTISFFFNFPEIIKVELLISSSFFILYFYKLLKFFFERLVSFFILLPVIPIILLIESRQNLLAATFFIIYIIQIVKNNKNELLPLSILISTMISKTFVPLLLLNFVNSLILNRNSLFKLKYSNKFVLKISLLIFLMTALFFQSDSKFNNHMLYDAKYVPPINLNNPLEIGFFQFNNQRLNDKDQNSNEDWYNSFQKNYKNKNSLIKVIINEPFLFIDHLIINIPKLTYEIVKKTTGYFIVYQNKSVKILLICISTFLLIIGLFEFYKKFRQKNLIPLFFYLLIFFTSLVVTNPSERYVSLIMPCIFIIFFLSLNKFFKEKFFLAVVSLCLFISFFNYKYYLNFVKIHFQQTKEISKFLELQNTNKIKILTNEKNFLSTINNINKEYIGFDSLPPYYDREVDLTISNLDFIIFSKNASSFNDISTKQGHKFKYYIKTKLNSEKMVFKKDNFTIIFLK